MATRCSNPRICARARAERNNGAQRFALCEHCQRIAILTAMGLSRSGRAIVSKAPHLDVGASSSNDLPPPVGQTGVPFRGRIPKPAISPWTYLQNVIAHH